MAAMLKVYYWPMLARGAPLVRMLEHTGTAYEYISDPSRFAEVCSNKGAQGNCFAPPVIVDGDTIISQSTAATAYLGNKLGLRIHGGCEFVVTHKRPQIGIHGIVQLVGCVQVNDSLHSSRYISVAQGILASV